MRRLYQRFKVRLEQISVHCGMQFVVAVPQEHVQRQADIQDAILQEILPEELQTEVEWQPTVPPLLREAELSPPVQLSVEGQEEDTADNDADQQQIPTTREPTLTFDPMTTVPQRSYEVQTTSTEDGQCCVTSVLITRVSRLLVLADNANMKVMCTPLDSAHLAHPPVTTRLPDFPWDLAQHQDDVIAVATDTHVIFLLRVAADVISTSARVETERAYRSVTSFGEGDLLVAGSVMDAHGPAVVDVITGEGRVLWTVGDDRTLPRLECPSCLHLCNRQVLVANFDGSIQRVDATSGLPYPALTHPDLKAPWQVTTDSGCSTLFATGFHADCVLVMSLTSQDQWRPLLTARDHGEGEYVRPRAVGVTDDGVMVVSWGHRVTGKTVVIAYDLNS